MKGIHLQIKYISSYDYAAMDKLYCYWCRRIRDQLLQDDRFSLAMEISTKCNLDTLSVWASWGMAWLKVGDFEKAREKLKLCFLV